MVALVGHFYRLGVPLRPLPLFSSHCSVTATLRPLSWYLTTRWLLSHPPLPRSHPRLRSSMLYHYPLGRSQRLGRKLIDSVASACVLLLASPFGVLFFFLCLVSILVVILPSSCWASFILLWSGSLWQGFSCCFLLWCCFPIFSVSA